MTDFSETERIICFIFSDFIYLILKVKLADATLDFESTFKQRIALKIPLIHLLPSLNDFEIKKRNIFFCLVLSNLND